MLRAIPAAFQKRWENTGGAVPTEWKTGDPVAFDLMNRRSADGSPGWARLNELIQEELAKTLDAQSLDR